MPSGQNTGPITPENFVTAADTDGDQTVDLKELEALISGSFDRLEKNNDGTLDARELKGHLTARQIIGFDLDSSGTLDKNEYLGAAQTYFKTIDADIDGVIASADLKGPGGIELIKML